MLRLILCLLIVLSGVMIGLYCSQRLLKRKATLSEFSSMLCRAKLLISYSDDELCRGLSFCRGTGRYYRMMISRF